MNNQRANGKKHFYININIYLFVIIFVIVIIMCYCVFLERLRNRDMENIQLNIYKFWQWLLWLKNKLNKTTFSSTAIFFVVNILFCFLFLPSILFRAFSLIYLDIPFCFVWGLLFQVFVLTSIIRSHPKDIDLLFTLLIFLPKMCVDLRQTWWRRRDRNEWTTYKL